MGLEQRGLERGAVRKAYRKGMVRVALLYPSTYEVAMSSLIVHRLYFWLSDMEEVWVERAFLSSPRGPPEAVRGLEGGTPLPKFDFVLVPVHYELDYANIVRALVGSGVPVRSSERKGPKIIVGGPAPTANPEPIADVADAVVIGDFEAVSRRLEEVIAGGAPLEPSDGIYVPSMGKHEVRAAVAPSVPRHDPRRIMAPQAPFTIAVEVSRGCPFSCMFCMESHISRPYREAPLGQVVEEAAELYRAYGLRVALVGLTVNARRDFKELLRALNEAGVSYSLPSLRAELLDEEAVDLIARAGQRTITLAPETSERLRRALGKSSADEDFVRVARAAAARGMAVKLYMMVGVPGETEEDIREAARLTREIKAAGVRELELSVNPLVIKPRTPLQWLPMMPEGELNARLRALREAAAYDRLSHYDPFEALVQASIALGDRDVLKFVVDAALGGGGRGAWRRAASGGLLSVALRPRRSPLPWSHVRVGPDEAELWSRLEAYARLVGLDLAALGASGP